jgi:hypothetical protein
VEGVWAPRRRRTSGSGLVEVPREGVGVEVIVWVAEPVVGVATPEPGAPRDAWGETLRRFARAGGRRPEVLEDIIRGSPR